MYTLGLSVSDIPSEELFDTWQGLLALRMRADAYITEMRARFDKATNVAELIALAKAQPGKLNVAVAGIGSANHLAGEMLRRDAGIDILTMGQYLQPTGYHLPVDRWVHPDEFAEWKRIGEEMSIAHVEAGPLVRSSYHAGKQLRRAVEAGVSAPA